MPSRRMARRDQRVAGPAPAPSRSSRDARLRRAHRRTYREIRHQRCRSVDIPGSTPRSPSSPAPRRNVRCDADRSAPASSLHESRSRLDAALCPRAGTVRRIEMRRRHRRCASPAERAEFRECSARPAPNGTPNSMRLEITSTILSAVSLRKQKQALLYHSQGEENMSSPMPPAAQPQKKTSIWVWILGGVVVFLFLILNLRRGRVYGHAHDQERRVRF